MSYFFILASFFCNAQQLKECVVDENLTVYFPSAPDSIRQTGMKIFYVRNDSVNFQALVNDSIPLHVTSEKSFQAALEGIYEGYSARLQFFSVQKKDTVLGQTRGVFASARNEHSSLPLQEIYTFMTVVNGRGYIIQLISSKTGIPATTVEQYFKNFRFRGANYIPEKSIAYRIGYLLGVLFFIGVLVVIVLFIVRNLRRS
jgi:hypothetical protein